MKKIVVIIVIFNVFYAKAQSFAPQVGFNGSTAIHKNDALFIDWANSVSITRGYLDIEIPENGEVDYGVSSNAIGQANNAIVSLGDSGEAILTFNHPIRNGQGADFAIFENGFLEEQGSEMAFLELAFVEVSTDGITYVRFPSVSEVSTTTQIDGFGFINAREINNLAGKYIVDYGTPFDLEDLTNLVQGTTVDLNTINYIKIIDVVGNINPTYASFDSQNNIINEPYPTAFSSGGFDLNAVGVIHNTTTSSVNKDVIVKFTIYPNPVTDVFNIQSEIEINSVKIYSLQGKELFTTNNTKVNVSFLDEGVYVMAIETENNLVRYKFIKR